MDSAPDALYGDVFASLDDASVDFVVVGGFAVVAHGHARLTVGADLVIDLAPRAAHAAMAALTGLGLRPRLPVDPGDFADAEVRQGWIDERGLDVFTFNDPTDPLRQVDIFAAPPIPWHALLADAALVTIGGRTVRVASIDHLITMKRPQAEPRTWRTSMPSAGCRGNGMPDWDAATFEGSQAQLRHEVARTSAARRFRWLAASRRHAATTGALQAELDRRTQAQVRKWCEHER